MVKTFMWHSVCFMFVYIPISCMHEVVGTGVNLTGSCKESLLRWLPFCPVQRQATRLVYLIKQFVTVSVCLSVCLLAHITVSFARIGLQLCRRAPVVHCDIFNFRGMGYCTEGTNNIFHGMTDNNLKLNADTTEFLIIDAWKH